MAEWGKAQGCDGKVRMLSDLTTEFSEAIGMSMDLSKVLGGVRSKR